MAEEHGWHNSRHWKETEREYGATSLRSLDVRWVLLRADYRRRHPNWWERVRVYLHRLKAARIKK